MKHSLATRAMATLLLLILAGEAFSVRIKELARLDGDREFRLVGYGLVVGLAGTGDSDRNRVTRQSLANALARFQLTVKESDLQSRNTAAVIVTATTRAWREAGDRIDVQVSSLGDARSLQGGTLMLTPLDDADGTRHALAQGAVTTGSFSYELNATSVQRNHPTVGVVARGATLERAGAGPMPSGAVSVSPMPGTDASLLLDRPDMTNALRISQVLATVIGLRDVRVVHPGKVAFRLPDAPADVPVLLARIEALQVEPDQPARLVINERTGTLVAGGDIVLGRAVIAQDDLRIEINTEYLVSQPVTQFLPNGDIATVTVPKSEIAVHEDGSASVVSIDRTATVLDLVNTLRRARVPTKSMIPIFQSLREAGALNAEIVVQ